MNYCKVLIGARLTRDPEIRYLPSNTAVCQLGLAFNRRWTNQQGEQQEETTFVDAEAFGRTAEVLGQYLSKGRPVFIEGRLKLDVWDDRDGNKRSKLKVIVERFEFIDSKSDGNDDGPRRQPSPSTYDGPTARHAQQPEHQPVEEDDIPF